MTRAQTGVHCIFISIHFNTQGEPISCVNYGLWTSWLNNLQFASSERSSVFKENLKRKEFLVFSVRYLKHRAMI